MSVQERWTVEMAGDDGDDWISLYKRAIGATPTKIRYLVATIPFIIQLYIGYLFSQNIQTFIKNPEITAGIMASYIVLVIFAVLYEVRSVSDDEESDDPSVDEADSSVDSAQLDLDDVSVQVLVRELQRLHEETATSEEIEEVQQRLDRLEDAISEREEGVASTSADKENRQSLDRVPSLQTVADRREGTRTAAKHKKAETVEGVSREGVRILMSQRLTRNEFEAVVRRALVEYALSTLVAGIVVVLAYLYATTATRLSPTPQVFAYGWVVVSVLFYLFLTHRRKVEKLVLRFYNHYKLLLRLR